MTEQDPFDSLLSLEDTFYQEGYALGVADGSKAGRIEGRVFGLEKGFDKFAAMGQLHGRAAIWGARMPKKTETKEEQEEGGERVALPPLPYNPRLEKHIHTLYALVEPDSLSKENAEADVSEFDDRFKRAGAKAKVIERLVGDGNVDTVLAQDVAAAAAGAAASSSSASSPPAHPRSSLKVSRTDRGDSSMEDFGGGKGVRI